jgi:outer membrane protein OmpA-like peptidoglycan-associated protein
MSMLRGLTTVLALGLIAISCAPQTQPPRPVSPPPAAVDPVPFSDRELADELARQGVGVPKDAPTPVPPPAGDELPTEIQQTPRGVVVTFRNVLFTFDSADLSPQARREIERMAFVLNHPRAIARQIALDGHADAIGTHTYNLELSRRRANSVAQELVARGVRRDRLTVEAFGKRRPIAPNTLPDGKDNPAGRALNRRVEAIVRAQGGSPR